MNSKNVTYLCPCKEGMHVLDTSFPVWSYVHETIKSLGENVTVVIMGLTGEAEKYSVPRIYMAIHGLKAAEMKHLGFKKIV